MPAPTWVMTCSVKLPPVWFSSQPPGVAETIDWAEALTTLGCTQLDEAFVQATLGTVLKFVTFPFRLMTLGVLTLVINAGLLLLAAYLVNGFDIDTFFAAFFGSILLSLATWFATWLLRAIVPEKSDKPDKAK